MHLVRIEPPDRRSGMLARNGNKLAPWASRSCHQAISAAFRDEYLGFSRVALDFLPEAVNVGFQRMRRHRGVVAPHFVQKCFATDGLAGAIEKLEDIRLFLGETDFLALLIDEHFGAGAKRESGAGRVNVRATPYLFSPMIPWLEGPDPSAQRRKEKWQMRTVR